jgi:hypothetical protein
MGRIGASISQPSGSPGDGTGTSPPQLTAGAWFTQLAVGGSNLTNWNVLITPDSTNPLGSQFLIRNIHLLSVDYPAQYGSPANNEYKLEFGNSVWMGGGLTGGLWQFPGIHIYEVDNSGNNFGATFLNRGLVLRGTQNEGYPVLASLVTFNGQSSGNDYPPGFWAELAMYSPNSPYNRTVYLASGSASSGSGYFFLADVNGNTLFAVDQSGNVQIYGVLQGRLTSGGAQTPVNARAYNLSGYGPVIDASGTWLGKPVPSAVQQTPWTQNINAAGFNLSGAGNITANQYFVAASGNPVINTNGQFVGAGVSVNAGIACTYLQVTANWIDCPSIHCSGDINLTGTLYAGGISVSSVTSSSGNFSGNLTVNGTLSAASFSPNTMNVGGTVTCNSLSTQSITVGGIQRCNSSGIWVAGVQCNDYVLARQFGIYNVAFGWTGDFTVTVGGVTKTCSVQGGIVTNVY